VGAPVVMLIEVEENCWSATETRLRGASVSPRGRRSRMRGGSVRSGDLLCIVV